jgi:hypothetical protein
MVTIFVGLFFVVFVSGFVLQRGGAPYSVVMMAIHKIVSIVVAVAFGLLLFRAHREDPLAGVVWLSAMSTALFFATTVATGGMLSTEKPWPAVISALHKVAPWLTVISVAVTLYVMVG